MMQPERCSALRIALSFAHGSGFDFEIQILIDKHNYSSELRETRLCTKSVQQRNPGAAGGVAPKEPRAGDATQAAERPDPDA
jgi:hypothetical protein